MVLYVLLVVETLHVDAGTYFIALLKVDHILNCTAFGLFVAFRQFIYLEPVQTTHLGEEHHRRVHRSLVNVLDEILITSTTGFRTDTAACLLTEVCQRRTFDITEVRYGNYHIIVGIHILRVELGSHLHDPGTTLVAVFLFDLHKLFVDDVVTHLFAGEQLVEVSDEFLDLLILLLQLIDTQAGESTQTHIYDRFRLQVVQVETCLEVRLSVCRSTAGTDDTNYLVDVIYGNDQAL